MFTYAGVSTLNGTVKVRYANGADRAKTLIKNGHKDVRLIKLPYPMTKADAVKHLIEIEFDNNAVATAMADELRRQEELVELRGETASALN